MKVSDYINSFLKKNDIKFVFEMSGGMIAHILDSIYQKNELKKNGTFPLKSHRRGLILVSTCSKCSIVEVCTTQIKGASRYAKNLENFHWIEKNDLKKMELFFSNHI